MRVGSVPLGCLAFFFFFSKTLCYTLFFSCPPISFTILFFYIYIQYICFFLEASTRIQAPQSNSIHSIVSCVLTCVCVCVCAQSAVLIRPAYKHGKGYSSFIINTTFMLEHSVFINREDVSPFLIPHLRVQVLCYSALCVYLLYFKHYVYTVLQPISHLGLVLSLSKAYFVS